MREQTPLLLEPFWLCRKLRCHPGPHTVSLTFLYLHSQRPAAEAPPQPFPWVSTFLQKVVGVTRSLAPPNSADKELWSDLTSFLS